MSVVVVWRAALTETQVEMLKAGIAERRTWRNAHRDDKEEAIKRALAYHDTLEDYILDQIPLGLYEQGKLTVRVPLDGWPQASADDGFELSEWPWPDGFLIEHVAGDIREVPLALMMAWMSPTTTDKFYEAHSLLKAVDESKVRVVRL
jgi:hypothetical protein